MSTQENTDFIADGPTSAGYQTKGTNITIGVDVAGNQIGVRGTFQYTPPTSTTGGGVFGTGWTAVQRLSPPVSPTVQPLSLAGVWGVGDHYGVYGASNFLYDLGGGVIVDDTPVLSPDIGNSAQSIGAIGVVGAGYKAPGVVGTSALTNTDVSSANIATGVIGGIVSTSTGVIGISGQHVSPQQPEVAFRTAIGCAGVMGISVRDMTDMNSPLDAGVTEVLHQNGAAGGIGVFGWSFRGRGGVFGSASVLPAAAASLSNPDQASAQIRLLPAPVETTRLTKQTLPPSLMPKLPRNGQPGDLMATTVADPAAVDHLQTRLWFCVEPNLWAEVMLGQTFAGSYDPPT
jgi:hypothetical protein